MLDIIRYNPFRILGVCGNSSQKEITANKVKIQRFLQVKRSCSFAMDLYNVLSPITKTQELIEAANNKVSITEGRIKFAQFWFIQQTSIDEDSLNMLSSGNIDSAIELWEKEENVSSLQNLFVCYLIKEDYDTAIYDCAVQLCKYYSTDFSNVISENVHLTEEIMMHNIIDMLIAENIDLTRIFKSGIEPLWSDYIQSKLVEPFVSCIENAISRAEAAKSKGWLSSLESGFDLMHSTQDALQKLSRIWGKRTTQYQLVADKLAEAILGLAIHYYRNTDEFDSPIKSKDLFIYADLIAEGQMAKDRCKKNLDTIQDELKSMPPAEVVDEARAIKKVINEYQSSKDKYATAYWLIDHCRESIVAIKEKLGNNNEYYQSVSSQIANLALGYTIKEVNSAQDSAISASKRKDSAQNSISSNPDWYKAFANYKSSYQYWESEVKLYGTALRSAWQVVLLIDLMGLSSEFKDNRYNKNRKSLLNLINEVKGFNSPIENNLLQGCCYNLRVDNKTFWCETDYYNACKNKSACKQYLQKFPNGKYVQEIQKKLDEIKKHDKRIVFIVLGVLVILVAIIAIIGRSSHKSPTPTEQSQPSTESVEYNEYPGSGSDYEDYNSDYSGSGSTDYSDDESYDNSDDEEENESYNNDDEEEQNDDSYSSDNEYEY